MRLPLLHVAMWVRLWAARGAMLALAWWCVLAPLPPQWSQAFGGHQQEEDCCCGSECFMGCSLDARETAGTSPLRWIPVSRCAESCPTSAAASVTAHSVTASLHGVTRVLPRACGQELTLPAPLRISVRGARPYSRGPPRS